MSGYLIGQLLVAMPQMEDSRFQESVLLVCKHDKEGAMGITLNRPRDDLQFESLMKQVKIAQPRFNTAAPIYDGGPVEQTRGTVIHSTDHMLPGSISITNDMAMTSNTNILREIAEGNAPNKFIITLGHASWEKGQLEQELKNNVWLTLPYEQSLIFNTDFEDMWGSCFTHLGISTAQLSATAGHA